MHIGSNGDNDEIFTSRKLAYLVAFSANWCPLLVVAMMAKMVSMAHQERPVFGNTRHAWHPGEPGHRPSHQLNADESQSDQLQLWRGSISYEFEITDENNSNQRACRKAKVGVNR